MAECHWAGVSLSSQQAAGGKRKDQPGAFLFAQGLTDPLDPSGS